MAGPRAFLRGRLFAALRLGGIGSCGRRGSFRLCFLALGMLDGSVVRGALHAVAQIELGIGGVATVVEKVDRNPLEALGFPAQFTRFLQRRLPMSSF